MTRWCGFNLCEMFVTPEDERWPDMTPSGRGRFFDDDFSWIRDWGFNFVRLPLTYRYWSPRLAEEIDESAFEPIDRAIEQAHRCGLHVSIALHHVPGYCINPPMRKEAHSLWASPLAQRQFAAQWEWIARRYRSASADSLSFNLVNEPIGVGQAQYAAVMGCAIESIRSLSPQRTIIIDGLDAGVTPVTESPHPSVVQSCRGYLPAEVTHHRAWWAGFHQHPPGWPLLDSDGAVLADRSTLDSQFAPWRSLREAGTLVHCGEFGAYKHTPHDVVLAWMRDLLEVLTAADIGFALWNFRGSFGILDSDRRDVRYADWHGHALDTSMLRMLQSFL